jgi:hypothetical protein
MSTQARPHPKHRSEPQADHRPSVHRETPTDPGAAGLWTLQLTAGNRAVQHMRQGQGVGTDPPRGRSDTRSSTAVLQRDKTYTYQERDVAGQRRGQSREARVSEISQERAAEIRQGAAGARGNWDREMAVFRDNVMAVYARMEDAHRVVSEAMYEAWENHQAVLGEIRRAREMRAAIAAAVIGIGLSVVSAGAGSLAGATMARVAGRFANTGTRQFTAIQEMLVESVKQGIQVGGGAILRPNVETPTTLGNVTSPRQFKDRGLSAIAGERADSPACFLRSAQYLSESGLRCGFHRACASFASSYFGH